MPVAEQQRMALSHLSATGDVHHGIVSTCPTCTRPELNTSRWQRTRARARARDGNACRMADPTCNGILSVHHLERGGTDDLDNLVTLCRRHHEQAERGGFFDNGVPTHPPPFRETHSRDAERTPAVG